MFNLKFQSLLTAFISPFSPSRSWPTRVKRNVHFAFQSRKYYTFIISFLWEIEEWRGWHSGTAYFAVWIMSISVMLQKLLTLFYYLLNFFFSPKSLKWRRLFIKVSVYQSAVCHHGFKMCFSTNVPSLFFAILSVSCQTDTFSRSG